MAVTLYVDTSALVRRYLRDRHSSVVVDAMADDDAWCASVLVRTEAQLALHRASSSARQQADLWRELRDEWDAFWVVPMDDRCTARAVEIGATYGVRTWPRPIGCPRPCGTSPSSGSRSPPPTPSASR